MNYCSKCGNLINEEHKFCTKCGTKIEEQVEEEIIVNDSQSNQNKKENIPNYNKIGGFLIFIGIMLVLGLLGTLTSFNENYTNEYYESLSTLYKSNNELFTLLNISYYLTVICLFFLILLNISFFTKSNITKKLAITYFTLLIITDIYGVYIFLDNKEIMSKLSIEIIKISFQIVSASLFIIYFSISKRVKETFIEEKNFGLHVVIASIVPIILFFYYSDKLNEIKNVSLEKEIIKNKSEVQSTIKREEKNQIEKKFTIIDSPEMKHKINNFLNGFIYLLTDEKYYSIQYIDDVIYYDWGKTQGYKAHNDKINLIKKWPYLQYSVKSIDSIKQDESGNYIVEFKLNFKSWNFKRKGFQGVAQYKLVITKYMTQILEENSKVLSRGPYNAVSNYVNNLPFIGKKRFDDSFGLTNIVELKESGQMKIINGHYRSGGWYVSYEGDFVNFYSKTKILFHSDAVCEEKYNECVPLSDTNENADEYLE